MLVINNFVENLNISFRFVCRNNVQHCQQFFGLLISFWAVLSDQQPNPLKPKNMQLMIQSIKYWWSQLEWSDALKTKNSELNKQKSISMIENACSSKPMENKTSIVLYFVAEKNKNYYFCFNGTQPSLKPQYIPKTMKVSNRLKKLISFFLDRVTTACIIYLLILNAFSNWTILIPVAWCEIIELLNIFDYFILI